MSSATTRAAITRVLSLARDCGLAYPDDELLACFIEQAVEPAEAARYILHALQGEAHPSTGTFVADWKDLILQFFPSSNDTSSRHLNAEVIASVTRRDNGRCCITGQPASQRDPLRVSPVLADIGLRIKQSQHDMLRAFLGPNLTAWVISDASKRTELQSHWLISRSAEAAMSRGFFRFPVMSPVEFRIATLEMGGSDIPKILDTIAPLQRGFTLDHSKTGIDTLDMRALTALSHFAVPRRWVEISRDVAAKQAQPIKEKRTTGRRLLQYMRGLALSAFATVWRFCLPAVLRARAYHGLQSIGARMYGPSCSFKVQRLPLGLYLKVVPLNAHQCLVNEYGALKLVRQHTSVPVPRPLDLVSDSNMSYLVTSRTDGLMMGQCIATLTEHEMSQAASDLSDWVIQLRSIPRPKSSRDTITNAVGQACYDHRVNAAIPYDEARGNFAGPFANEEEFHDTIRPPALPDVRQSGGHEIVFTHSDLNLRNVLIDSSSGRLSALVDWECSGWYPEYWDLTKARYVTKLQRRWLGLVDRVFAGLGDYRKELAIENQLWERCY